MKRTNATVPHAPRWALPLIALPVLALPACTRAPAEVQPSAQASAPVRTAPQVVKYGASWAQYCRSMKDLKGYADIAVMGVVSEVAPAVQPTADGPVFSTVTLAVASMPWSRVLTTPMPETVSFVETGGTYQGVTYEVEDEPLLQVGDRVLIFFTEYSPGKYRVTGGPTGRFSVAGGVVKPIVEDGVQVAAGTSASSLFSSL